MARGQEFGGFQRSEDRHGGWAVVLITQRVGSRVVAATARALGMKRCVLFGFSLASIVLYAVVIAVTPGMETFDPEAIR